MNYIPAPLKVSNSRKTAASQQKSEAKRPTMQREASRSMRSLLKKALPSRKSLRKIRGRRRRRSNLVESSTMSTITVGSESTNVSAVSFAERCDLYFGFVRYEKPAPDQSSRASSSFWSQIARDRLEEYGPESLATASGYLERGQADLTAGHLSRAIKAFSTAAGIFEHSFGIHHLGFPRSLHWVSKAALQAGKLEIAFSAAKQAFTIRQNELGPLHVDTIDTYCQMSYVLVEMGQKKRAAVCLTDALKAVKAVFGQANQATFEVAKKLAELCTELGKPEKARRHYKVALKSCRALGQAEDVALLEQKMYELGISETRLDI